MTVTMDRRGFLILGACGLLVACETPNPVRTYPSLSFRGQPLILLRVASIEVVDEYRMPLADPNVEHRAPIAPAAGIERWAQDVLQPAGSGGRAVLRITEGSLIETPLKKTEGLKSLITTDQSERYDATTAGVLEIYNQGGAPVGRAEARASRYQTVAEDVTLNDREQVWYSLVENTVRDFAKTMEIAIRRDLAPYVG